MSAGLYFYVVEGTVCGCRRDSRRSDQKGVLCGTPYVPGSMCYANYNIQPQKKAERIIIVRTLDEASLSSSC